MAKRYKLGDVADKAECIVYPGAKTASGYPIVWREGKTQSYTRYIWKQKHGKIPKGKIVCHHCDNPSCINEEHLFLGTHQDNTRDMQMKGRYRSAIGEAHGLAKMTDESVREMRKDWRKGLRVFELVKKYDLSRTAVWKIVNNITWTHVK